MVFKWKDAVLEDYEIYWETKVKDALLYEKQEGLLLATDIERNMSA